MYTCALCKKQVEDAAQCLLDEYLCANCCRAVDGYIREGDRECARYLQECLHQDPPESVAAYIKEMLQHETKE